MGNNESSPGVHYGTGSGGGPIVQGTVQNSGAVASASRDSTVNQSLSRSAATAIQAPNLPPVSPNTLPPGGGPC